MLRYLWMVASSEQRDTNLSNRLHSYAYEQILGHVSNKLQGVKHTHDNGQQLMKNE